MMAEFYCKSVSRNKRGPETGIPETLLKGARQGDPPSLEEEAFRLQSGTLRRPATYRLFSFCHPSGLVSFSLHIFIRVSRRNLRNYKVNAHNWLIGRRLGRRIPSRGPQTYQGINGWEWDAEHPAKEAKWGCGRTKNRNKSRLHTDSAAFCVRGSEKRPVYFGKKLFFRPWAHVARPQRVVFDSKRAESRGPAALNSPIPFAKMRLTCRIWRQYNVWCFVPREGGISEMLYLEEG